MFYINVSKLIGKIAERGFSKSSFANECNMNRNTLTDYLKNPKKIPYSAMLKMANVLKLTYAQAVEIFFESNQV